MRVDFHSTPRDNYAANIAIFIAALVISLIDRRPRSATSFSVIAVLPAADTRQFYQFCAVRPQSRGHRKCVVSLPAFYGARPSTGTGSGAR